MNRIKRYERTNLKPEALDALMRITLTFNDIKTVDPNIYTEQYHRPSDGSPGHFLCDHAMAADRTKKMEQDLYTISTYSTIF